ncbi:PAS domain S-box protein [Gorillibacterium sp. sgz500922]|uniref:hybrid sensor histidine kinase/response regulator n=1 Tax=Gorillibacterium sp. sgz500922 TaxID=3446694 RepID=UPI003F66F272
MGKKAGLGAAAGLYVACILLGNASGERWGSSGGGAWAASFAPCLLYLVYLGRRRDEKHRLAYRTLRLAFAAEALGRWIGLVPDFGAPLAYDPARPAPLTVGLFLIPRLLLIVSLVQFHRANRKRFSKLQLLWDQWTLAECAGVSLWFLFLRDRLPAIAAGDPKTCADLLLLAVQLVLMSGLLLSGMYRKAEGGTGFPWLLAGLSVTAFAEIGPILGKQPTGPILGSALPLIAFVCLVVGGLLPGSSADAGPGSGTDHPPDEGLRRTLAFLVFPALVLVYDGFSAERMFPYLIVIMAYCMVRLYVRQLNASHQLLAAEQEFSERMRLYQNVLDQLPLTVVITDRDKRIEYVNRYFVELTGYSREEAVGLTPAILQSGKTPKQTYLDMNGAMQRGEKWSGEFVNRMKSGREYTEEVIIAPIQNASRTVTHYIGIKENITDLKRVRRQLSDQLAFTNQLIDTLPHPLFYLDVNGFFVGCNKAYEQAFRVDRNRLIGRDYHSTPHLSPASADTLGRMLDEASRRSRSASRQLQRVFADGKNHDILYSISAYRLSEGQIGGFLGIITDISDLKEKEKELINSRNFLDAIIDHIPLMLYVKDVKELRFHRVNRACAEFFGKTTEAVQGLSDYELFPSELAARLREADREVLASGLPREVIEEMGEGANKRYLHASKLPIYDADGEPIFLLGVSEDITDNRRKEEELKQALHRAEEATAAKSQFLANMSHEIRTPLNAIIGMAHLALKTETNPKQRGYLANIQQGGTTLLNILNEVLDYSKLESGKIELEAKEFGLKETVREASELFAQQAAEKGLALRTVFAQDLPARLTGDSLRLRQVLMNLVSNAVKFTERGEIEVRAERLRRTDGRIKLAFEVSDSGIGIGKDNEHRLFEAFVQADSSTTRRYGGTGLGLAICKRLTEQMGGQIGVRARDEGGSVFRFTAWFQEVPEPGHPAEAADGPAAAAGQASPPEGKETRRRRLAGVRILLVEDNAINQQIALEMLASQGIRTAVANNGAEAVKAMQEQVGRDPFQLILMDLQMPVLDGFAAASRIRSSHAEIPIIALTAGTFAQEKERCLESGMNDYLAKPIDADLLFSMLGKWLPALSEPSGYSGAVSVPPSHARSGARPPFRVDGLNAEAALNRLGGHEELYRRLLMSFADSQRELAAQLRKAGDAQDWSAVHRLAHNLKGLSGNVGAHSIQELSDRICAILSEPGPLPHGSRVGPMLTELEQRTDSLSAALTAALADNLQAGMADERPEIEAAMPLLRTLIRLLQESDAEAADFYEEHRPAWSGIWRPDDLAELDRLMHAFDYEQAIIRIGERIPRSERDRDQNGKGAETS